MEAFRKKGFPMDSSRSEFLQQTLLFQATEPSTSEEENVLSDITQEPLSEELPIAEAPSCWTVSDLTVYLADLIASDGILGRSLTVQGELSNVSVSSRGHCYFTLKDDKAAVKGVLWASLMQRIPFKLEDGMAVFLSGQLEIYAPNGTYSIVGQKIEPIGVGSLQLAFQQLKARLETEGFFLEEYKKPIPAFPKKIGIVTAKTGAVIHDMLRVIRRKNPSVDVLLFPVKVQGEGAAQEIAHAIEALNRPEYGLDVLIVARGGGSFEDLFCFSEEPVVKAVFHSRTPIVTGIGHEPDYSLADAASDYSASTPTAAAEYVVPDVEALRLDLQLREQGLIEAIAHIFLRLEQQFDGICTELIQGQQERLHRLEQALGMNQERLLGVIEQYLLTQDQGLAKAIAELNAYNPLDTLSRGYALVSKPDGTLAKSAADLHPGDQIQLQFQDGQRPCEVKAS